MRKTDHGSRNHLPRVLVIALAAVLSAWVRPARAELTWVRTEHTDACASPEQLTARLRALGVSEQALSARRVEGVVEPLSIGFRAHLRVQERDGSFGPTRGLETVDPNCAHFTPEVALVIATLFGTPTPRVVLPDPEPAPRDAFERFEFGLQLGVSIGLLYGPGVSPGFGFRFTTAQRVGALFGLGFSANPDSLYVNEPNSPALDIYALQSPTALCVDAVRSRRFLVVPCAGVTFGALLLDDGDNQHLGRAFYATATLGVRVALNLTRDLRIYFQLDGGALLTGPVYRFGYAGDGIRYEDVYRPERVQLFPALGFAQAY